MSFCAVSQSLGEHLANVDAVERESDAHDRMTESLLKGDDYDCNEIQEVFSEAMFDDAWSALITSYRDGDDLAFMQSLRAAVGKRIDALAAKNLDYMASQV